MSHGAASGGPLPSTAKGPWLDKRLGSASAQTQFYRGEVDLHLAGLADEVGQNVHANVGDNLHHLRVAVA
ncbi:hypothetical protein, partial [Zhongshania sp.]|uniref:hypothetical protein n=1 Tax=Zhongshania sp. TaxID=1971902 RepID=UPI003561B7FA